MHAALFLASALLVLLAGYLALGLLRRLREWPHRRIVQGVVLSLPLTGLLLGFAGLDHFAGRACFLGAPRWDRWLALALLAAMGLLAFGGLGLGLLRHALLRCVVARAGWPADPGLHALAASLATRLGIAPPRVLVCAHDRPLALACGLRCPAVLLSTWMLERLDRAEVEAVLAHELAHLARRDYPAVWLATILRDAFCYLPTSWAAYRQMQHEKELACDDLAVTITGRPLALASALVKAWQPSLGGPRGILAPSLVGSGGAIERRVARLLTRPGQRAGKWEPRGAARVGAAAAAAFTGFALIVVLNPVVALALLACGPAAALVGVYG